MSLTKKNISDLQTIYTLDLYLFKTNNNHFEIYKNNYNKLLDNPSLEEFMNFKNMYYNKFSELGKTRLDLISSDFAWNSTLVPVKAITKFKKNLKNKTNT